jgi:large subunit ribosomal protein L32
MGLPSKKRTRQSKRERWAHIKLEAKQGTTCPSCSAPVMPHRACKSCGTYRGKTVLDVTKKRVRKTRTAKAKA